MMVRQFQSVLAPNTMANSKAVHNKRLLSDRQKWRRSGSFCLPQSRALAFLSIKQIVPKGLGEPARRGVRGPGSHPPTAEKPRAERGLELCVTTPIP